MGRHNFQDGDRGSSGDLICETAHTDPGQPQRPTSPEALRQHREVTSAPHPRVGELGVHDHGAVETRPEAGAARRDVKLAAKVAHKILAGMDFREIDGGAIVWYKREELIIRRPATRMAESAFLEHVRD